MSVLLLLPRFASAFFSFWFAALSLLYAVSSSGGSSADAPVLPVSAASTLTSGPPIVSDAALGAGATGDFDKDTVPFAIVADVRTGDSFNLFSRDELTRLTIGRAYAQIVGPFTVEVACAISPKATVPVAQAEVAVCVARSTPVGYSPPSTIADVLAFPGAAYCFATHAAPAGPVPLTFGPGLNDNLFATPAYGWNPYLYAVCSSFNAGTVRLVFRGRLKLAGVGYAGTFFFRTPSATE